MHLGTMSTRSRCSVQRIHSALRLWVQYIRSCVFVKKLTVGACFQQGELEHRNTKGRYMHTNKQNYIDQMVNLDMVEKVHERMSDEVVATTQMDDIADPALTPAVNQDFPAGRNWCRIAQDQSQKLYLPHFLSESQNASDPAYKVSTGM
jgi:hypothetical protein